MSFPEDEVGLSVGLAAQFATEEQLEEALTDRSEPERSDSDLRSQRRYKPVLTKRALVAVAACAALLLGVAAFAGSSPLARPGPLAGKPAAILEEDEVVGKVATEKDCDCSYDAILKTGCGDGGDRDGGIACQGAQNECNKRCGQKDATDEDKDSDKANATKEGNETDCDCSYDAIAKTGCGGGDRDGGIACQGVQNECEKRCGQEDTTQTTTTTWVDPCLDFPLVKYSKAIHSNLGRKGPDAGDEGVIYEVTDESEGGVGKAFMVLHAVGNYTPFEGAMKINGMCGEYACVQIATGTSAKIRMGYFSDDNGKPGKPIKIPKAAITFFDLDTDKNASGTESVEVDANNFTHAYLSPTTEVKHIHAGHTPGSTSKDLFMASTYGTGQDNPKSPVSLTAQQMNRAATLTFDELSEFEFTISSSPKDKDGLKLRVFLFAGRPSVQCAEVKGATTTTAAPKNSGGHRVGPLAALFLLPTLVASAL